MMNFSDMDLELDISKTIGCRSENSCLGSAHNVPKMEGGVSRGGVSREQGHLGTATHEGQAV